MIRLNGFEIKPTIFPDGTSQVWKIPEDHILNDGNHVEWEFESEGEFMHLAQLFDLLTCKTHLTTPINLELPFLPYGRQDKPVSNETTFARSTFLRHLNLIGFDRITTLDAHSRLPGMMVEDRFPEAELDFAFDEVSPDIICFPDEGAKKRYQKFFGKFPTCSLSKDRDQKTGYITRMYLNELVGLEGKNVLIVDDICDGGMTFKLAAEKLLQSGAKCVSLYTTHGIYSKGIGTLRESGISRIFNRRGEVK